MCTSAIPSLWRVGGPEDIDLGQEAEQSKSTRRVLSRWCRWNGMALEKGRHPMQGPCYKLQYLYRDGGNYKFWGAILLDGPVDVAELEETLIDGLYFLPQEVGLNSLILAVRNSDDHEFHEIVSVTESESDGVTISSEELMRRFILASSRGWKNAR